MPVPSHRPLPVEGYHLTGLLDFGCDGITVTETAADFVYRRQLPRDHRETDDHAHRMHERLRVEAALHRGPGVQTVRPRHHDYGRKRVARPWGAEWQTLVTA